MANVVKNDFTSHLLQELGILIGVPYYIAPEKNLIKHAELILSL